MAKFKKMFIVNRLRYSLNLLKIGDQSLILVKREAVCRIFYNYVPVCRTGWTGLVYYSWEKTGTVYNL